MKIKTRIKSTLLCLFVFLSSLVGILVCLIFQNAFSAQAAQECGIVSKYLRIGTDITMQYIVAVPEGAQDVKMTFTLNDKTTEVSDYTQGDGVRTYSYGGVTPQYLGADVTAALYYDGKEQDKNVSSVKDYLTQLIASSASDLGIGEKQAVSMQTLAKDVLFYGAAAQVYTQTHTDALVNEGYEPGTAWEAVSNRLSSAPAIATTGEKVFINANVSFGNHLVPFATFTLPEDMSLSDVTATVAGRTVSPVLVDEKTRLYKISYGGFSILDIDESFNYDLTVGDKTGTLTFSVAKYIETMAEKSTNAAFVDFIKATYVYAQSAKAYKTLSDTLTPVARHITLADGLEYGGETALTLSVGTVLSVADITVPEGKTLIGFKDNYDNYYADSYTVGADDVTLYPVWAVETVTQGDGKLDFGVLIGNNGPEITTRSYWYNVDSANTTTIIEGEKARVFAVTRKDKPVNADNTGLNSSFRASTDYAPVDSSRIHTLVYTIGNLGASDFAVQIYLRASGSDTVENHALYSTTVVVPAGKTATVALRTKMYNAVAASGSEMLNYFKFVETDGVTLPDSARLAVSVYGYTAAYGFASVEEGTFEDGSTTLLCKEGETLPRVLTKSGAATSHVAVGGVPYANGAAVMPADDVSVTAVDYTAVTSGSGALDWNAGSVQNNFGNPPASVKGAAAYRNGMVGTMLTVKPNASKTPTNFRTMTAYSSAKGTKYTFTYTFVNCGAEAITFTCWQVNSKNDTANMETSGEITLGVGETRTVMLETTKLGNTNAMCYYAWNSATDSAQMQLFVSTTVVTG